MAAGPTPAEQASRKLIMANFLYDFLQLCPLADRPNVAAEFADSPASTSLPRPTRMQNPCSGSCSCSLKTVKVVKRSISRKRCAALSPEAVAAAQVVILRHGPANEQQRKATELYLLDEIAKKPASMGLRVSLADYYQYSGERDRAIATYRQVLEREPNNVVALNNLAWTLATDSRNAADALALVERAINLAGPLDDLLDTRRRIRFESGDAQAGLRDLTEAVSEVPTATRLMDLAAMHRKAGQTDLADRACKRPGDSPGAKVSAAVKGTCSFLIPGTYTDARLIPGGPRTWPQSKSNNRSPNGSRAGSRPHRRSASSAWATSACRWPRRSPGAGSPSSASTSTPTRSQRLNRGESYIGHICAERVAELIDSGRFEATADFGRFVEADAIVICVPTPLTEAREPDLSLRRQHRPDAHAAPARRASSSCWRARTYPGTTEDVLQPILEESGLKAGEDFFLAFSPEREDPGNRDFSTRNIPKVVGGIDDASRELAVALYAADRRRRRAGLQHPGRRGVQDPGEHLPGRQHRPGQRAEGRLRPRWASTSGR